MQRNKNERGNVLVFVLIGVVLFAALAFTVARGFRSEGTSNLTKRELDLSVSDTLDYTQRLQRAVDRLRQRGCSESEISFENTTVSGYSFSTRDECKVFHPDGGSLAYTPPASISTSGYWFFTGLNGIEGSINGQYVGTEKADLVVFLRVSRDACVALNSRLNISNPGNVPPVEIDGFVNTDTDAQKFKGTFTDGNALTIANAYISGCVNYSNNYYFYSALVVR